MFFEFHVNTVSKALAGKYYVKEKGTEGIYVELPSEFEKFALAKRPLSSVIHSSMPAQTVVKSLLSVHEALKARDPEQVLQIHANLKMTVDVAPPCPEFPQPVATDPKLKHECQTVALKLGLDFLHHYIEIAAGSD